MRIPALLYPLVLGLLVYCLCAPAVAAPVAEPVEWTIGETIFRGTLVHDDASAHERPGLLMFPNWMGPTDAAVEHATRIAADRYVVLVVDMYGIDVRPDGREAASAAVRPLLADRVLLRERAATALEVLHSKASGLPLDTGRIAAIGFCFGGTVALELARSGADLDAAVSLHGSLSTDLPAEAGALKASILVLNGAADRSVPLEQIGAFREEMHAAGADWMLADFGGAVHCFAEPSADSPPGCVYDPVAAARATSLMHDFLAERFRSR